MSWRRNGMRASWASFRWVAHRSTRRRVHIPRAQLSQHAVAGHPLLLTLSMDIVGAMAAYACNNHSTLAFSASCFLRGSEPRSYLKVHGLTPRLGESGLVPSQIFSQAKSRVAPARLSFFAYARCRVMSGLARSDNWYP